MLQFQHKKTLHDGATIEVYTKVIGFRLPDDVKIGVTDEAWDAIYQMYSTSPIPFLDGSYEIYQVLKQVCPYVYKIKLSTLDGNVITITEDTKNAKKIEKTQIHL